VSPRHKDQPAPLFQENIRRPRYRAVETPFATAQVPIDAGITTIGVEFGRPLTNGTNIEPFSSYWITDGEI